MNPLGWRNPHPVENKDLPPSATKRFWLKTKKVEENDT
jgi:hypothetical protein